MFIVVYGNPFDGMTAAGPFNDGEDAAQWAEVNADESWWIVPLTAPTTEESAG